MGSTWARKSAPASINRTARVVRVNKAAPRSLSRCEMIRDTVGCGAFRSRPLAEKLPRRTTRVNKRSAGRWPFMARTDNSKSFSQSIEDRVNWSCFGLHGAPALHWT
jgi:hypothetical protein